MVKLHAGADPALVGWLAGLLQAAGIDCVTRNALLAGGAGALPPTECWPEIWLREERDLVRASALLEELLRPDLSGRYGWCCERCGEALEAQFDQCWNCGGWR